MSVLTESQLKLSLLISLENKSFGTGFFYKDEEEDIVFLVTAKHVLFDKNGTLRSEYITVTSQTANAHESEISIFNIDIKNCKIISHPTSDISILPFGYTRKSEERKGLVYYDWVSPDKKGTDSLLIVSRRHVLTYDDVKISNDVFVFGYPTSLGLLDDKQFDVSKPLLRKGIVANKYLEAQTIILDCPVYPGNSGGPVIQVGKEEGVSYLIGIISEYIPYVVKWYNGRDPLVNTEYMNSGYSVAVSMNPLIEMVLEEKRRMTNGS